MRKNSKGRNTSIGERCIALDQHSIGRRIHTCMFNANSAFMRVLGQPRSPAARSAVQAPQSRRTRERALMCGQPVRTITHTVGVWRVVKSPGNNNAKQVPDYKNLHVINGSFLVDGR